MTRLGVVFDIVLDLTTLGMAKADDSACLASINEGHVVQVIALWGKADHPEFFVLEAIVDPNKCLFPGEL